MAWQVQKRNIDSSFSCASSQGEHENLQYEDDFRSSRSRRALVPRLLILIHTPAMYHCKYSTRCMEDANVNALSRRGSMPGAYGVLGLISGPSNQRWPHIGRLTKEAGGLRTCSKFKCSHSKKRRTDSECFVHQTTTIRVGRDPRICSKSSHSKKKGTEYFWVGEASLGLTSDIVDRRIRSMIDIMTFPSIPGWG